MHPVEPPQCVRSKHGGVFSRPVFVDKRETLVNEIGNLLEMRWRVASDVYGLFAKPAAKLRNIRDSGPIQRPQCVFIECLDPLGETDFNTVGQQVVLPKKVSLL
jgi:hypothetical protein